MPATNPSDLMSRVVTRRQAVTAGLGAASLASLALGGCSNSTGPTESGRQNSPSSGGGQSEAASSSSSGASASVASLSTASAGGMPRYIPYEIGKPDLPATEAGVQSGFLKYPESLTQMHTGVPGSGGEVSSYTQFFQALATPLKDNPYWQQFNSMLGVKWKATIAAAEFYTKLATLIAGDDLPDLTMLPITGTPNLSEILEHKFTDLVPYLSGESVKDYPALAGFSPASWRVSMVNGVLAGTPLPRAQVGSVMSVRADYLAAKGLSADVSSPDDFITLCRELTDVKANRYAMGYVLNAWLFVQQVFRVPNGWEESGGKLVSAYETDAIKDAIGWFSELAKQGCFHPDAFAATGSTVNEWLYGGIVAMRMDPPGSIAGRAARMADPDASFALLKPPGGNGRPARQILGPGAVKAVIAVNKKCPPARVRELLSVVDWMASPFGTKEQQFFTCGIEGRDFEMTDGAPAITKIGDRELNVAPKVANAMPVIFNAGQPDLTKAIHEYESDMIPGGASDPTWGLYSPTATKLTANLDKQISDKIFGIAQGRNSMSDWAAAVKTWRSNGGDKIRQEYEEALGRTAS